MKKVLSLLGLVALLGLVMPANAAPPPQGEPHGGQMVQAGPNFGPQGGPRRDWGAPPPQRHHYGRGNVVVGGVLARRSYWSYPYVYDYRLGWHDDYFVPPLPPRPYYGSGVYVNFGFPIRF